MHKKESKKMWVWEKGGGGVGGDRMRRFIISTLEANKGDKTAQGKK